MPDAAASLPHIVVLGAGFAGLRFCQEFPTHLARITIVDRQNHHLFQPLLYQVATAGLSATDIAQPVRGILAGKANLVVLMAEVTGFDLAAKKVFLEGSELQYDYLVIALGGTASYFGHDDWAQPPPPPQAPAFCQRRAPDCWPRRRARLPGPHSRSGRPMPD